METVAIKPIIDVRYRGKHVQVQFALEHTGTVVRYNIIADGRPVRVRVFAEEVMRWLGDAMHEEEIAALTDSADR
jgi:hypothetical protein